MKRPFIILLTLALTVMGVAYAFADTTIRVTGNTVDTSLGENGSPGWWFNRDSAAHYEFTLDEASIGAGSLKAGPIVNASGNKFIAENFVWQPIDELESIAYDFLIAGDGDVSDANHFYLNVYANVDDSDNYYDCRFDYVPTSGSTSTFTTATFLATDTPADVRQRGDRMDPDGCPTSLDAMPEGSYVRMFAINVGDTSDNDEGLAGYLDNVVVTTTTDATIYDFEVPPPVKDACKDGGYADYGFANQGECVSSLQADGMAGK